MHKLYQLLDDLVCQASLAREMSNQEPYGLNEIESQIKLICETIETIKSKVKELK